MMSEPHDKIAKNVLRNNQELGTDHMASLASESSLFSPFSSGFDLYGDAFQMLNNRCSESSPEKLGISDDNNNDNGGLCKVFSGMSICDDEQGNGVGGARTGAFDVTDSSSYRYTLPLPASASLRTHDPCFSEETSSPCQRLFCNEGTSPSAWGADMEWGLDKGYTFGTPLESSLNLNRLRKQGTTTPIPCYGPVQLQTPSFSTLYPRDDFSPFVVDFDATWDVKSPFIFSQATPRITGGDDPVAFNCDDKSFTIQRNDVEYCVDHGYRYNPLSGCRMNSYNEAATHVPRFLENNSSLPIDVRQPLPLDLCSLSEDQRYIYRLAKDQIGSRLLQGMIEEGTPEDMRIVFEGVIDNVVELMMNPFGNHVLQKLLTLCREDQRFHIVLMLTKEPGQFVKTSLNTYGTRVVQKLIETLDSRKQLSLVRSAIQSGFLDLTKDPNGNHVIQRCLQCFSCQDNEFIFDAAAKFCVDVATHQHGCCVLKHCITYSVGKYQDKMVAEICKHGLLIAQDPFGNYVVQHIIELEIPGATNKLLSQFKGNFVYLSMQKFSSHVVEKFLKHIGESRCMIVRELLSVPHFEELLQDPYANYVVQRALEVTKGSLHASLVEAIWPHQILRTSPYCKRIFAGNLLKK